MIKFLIVLVILVFQGVMSGSAVLHADCEDEHADGAHTSACACICHTAGTVAVRAEMRPIAITVEQMIITEAVFTARLTDGDIFRPPVVA